MTDSKGIKKGEILCPHCYAKNSMKAYCCLKCFKVMRGKGKTSFLRTHFQKNRLFLLSGILFCLSSAIIIQKWLRGVEGHMTTIQDQNQQYYDSMTKYKKNMTDANKNLDEKKNKESESDELTALP